MSDGYRCDMCDSPMSREIWIKDHTCHFCLKSIEEAKKFREEINKRTEEYKNYLNSQLDPRD
jgi:hypothetical protein